MLAPVIVAIVTYLLTKQPKAKPTIPIEPTSEPSYVTEKDRFFMECDLTKHYLFDTVRDFQMTLRHDYRTNDTDSNIEKAIEIVGDNFINILEDVYMDEAIYWQRIFSGCTRTNSCVECVVGNQEFLQRQLDSFDSFVDLFSLFYSYYNYSYNEVVLFKKIIHINRDLISEIVKIKADIKKICLRDSVCIKKKMFRILERMHSFVQSVENGADEVISVARETLAESNNKKLFKKRQPTISVAEMKTKDIVRIVSSSDPEKLLIDFQESFELHEEKMRS